MACMDDISGILFDLDGVLFVGDRMIAGADTVVALVKQKQIPCRFITNTTTQSRDAIAQKLQGMGLSIQSREIISTPSAALLYLRQQGYRSCHLLVADEVKPEFEGIHESDLNPGAVVIGDIGSAWNYELLNKVFGMLMNGADLIALHKNKFWQTDEGLRMDIGAFVAGLEYVTGKQAAVIGKPSPAFFELAIRQLELPAARVVMIGDDIDSDVGGAQRAGLKGALVRTGKYRPEYAAASPIRPDYIFDSVADMLGIF
ncbi:MAG: TIGR01458 family HAD-type hydrolase [Methylomonas sp.]|nr:TIGR01458 family HAD-type hydrolase [Methylomonas sp.]